MVKSKASGTGRHARANLVRAAPSARFQVVAAIDVRSGLSGEQYEQPGCTSERLSNLGHGQMMLYDARFDTLF